MRGARLLFAILLAACGARTPLSESSISIETDGSVVPPVCSGDVPTCVGPPPASGEGACAAPTLVKATCAPGVLKWTCPQGAHVYARVTAMAQCHPFLGAGGLWRFGAFSRVPTDDGRCLWIADNATLGDGTNARNVAFLADPNAPFGTCPDHSLMPPTPIVTLAGGDDPSVFVQIDGGYRLGGVTHVVYRLFKADANAPMGGLETSGGIARWDPSTQRIVVPAPSSPQRWGLDLDLGDAILDDPDGAHTFVYGCHQNGPGFFLVHGCELARVDAKDDVELWSDGGAWIPNTDSSLGAVLFGSGSWTSSMVSRQGVLRHVYISDFGNGLKTQVASSATGPWSPGESFGPCHLPSGDPTTYCGGATVHEELADPMRPDEYVVSYGIGTRVPPAGNPIDYSVRLDWVTPP